MAEYRVDVFITSSEARKGSVEANSIDEAREAFDKQLDDHDIWEVTQDTGFYGDTEWEVTEIANDAGDRWRPEPTPRGYFLAELSTRNFDFTAFGTTEDEAMAAMQEGWRKHCEQSMAATQTAPSSSSLWTWEEIVEDVNVHQLVPGQCLRDGEPLSIIPF